MNGQLSLYSILDVSTDASQQEIKLAYRKLALKFHPDRNPSPEANGEFQKIGRAYEILSDPDRRSLYDSTGLCDDHDATKNWTDYFKRLFSQVSSDSIEEYKSSYVGSADELEDILASYVRHKGDILKVIDDVFFTTTKDINRLQEIVHRCIQKNIVPLFPLFEAGTSKKDIQKKRKNEEIEAAEATSFLLTDLVATIRSRRRDPLSEITSSLEEKYCRPREKKLKK